MSVDMASIGFKPQSIQNAVAIKVVGNSMMGEHIVDGDIAIIERGADARSGQIVVAYVDGEMTLKTLIVEKNKTFLRPANPKFKDIHPSFEMVIYGVFRALIRKTRD